MAGLGTGIAAFVNGFVGGREVKHSWEDRKDRKEWEKKLQEFRVAAEDRTAERHGWGRDTHSMNMAERGLRYDTARQIYDDEQEIRTALSAADAAAREGMVDTPVGPVAAGGATEAVATPAGAALGAQPAAVGPDMPRVGLGATAGAPATPDGPTAAPAAPAEDGVPPLFAQTPDGKVFAQRPPRDAQEKAQIAQAAKEGRLAQNPAEAGRQAEIDRIGEARATNRLYNTLAPNPEHEYFEPGGIGADVAEGAKAAARARLGAQDISLGALAGAVNMTVNRPVNAITRWATGRDFGEIGRTDWSGGANDTMPAPRAPGPKDATEGQQATVDAAATAMDEIGESPAHKAAAEGVELGTQPGRPISAEQRKKKSKDYATSYRENGLPLVKEAYLKQGRFEEAAAVDAFAKDQRFQAGMQAWAGAVFAALNGDEQSAFEGLADAYNSAGYMDDGLEIVKDMSELIRDESGKTVGVKIAWRNQDTGEVTVTEDTIEDVINKGIWIASPEKAMETMFAQQKAAQERMGRIAEEQRKTAGKLIETDFDATNKAALKIMETSVGLDGQPTISYDEALRMAQEARGGGAAPQTPVLHRPQ